MTEYKKNYAEMNKQMRKVENKSKSMSQRFIQLAMEIIMGAKSNELNR